MYDSFLPLDCFNGYDFDNKETVIRFDYKDNSYTIPADEKEIYTMFEANKIEEISRIFLERKKIKKQIYNGNENKEALKQQLEELGLELKKYINQLYFYPSCEYLAEKFLKQLKRGRISSKNLSDILLLHKIHKTDFTKKIVDEIRNNNLTIIHYKRNGKIFCVSADPNDNNLENLNVLKYTLDEKNQQDDVNIKYYTHGTWGDINDLIRCGFYKNKNQYDLEKDNISDKKKNNNTMNNYKAFFNSKNLFIKNDEIGEEADFYIQNNNYPQSSFFDIPKISGMSERGDKSAKIFNKVMQIINNYQNEKQKNLNKNIITTGVSNGNIHILKSLQNIDTSLLNQNDKISLDLESIPSYGIFTADPKDETSECFLKALFKNNSNLYQYIDKIKIETNLSQKYHPFNTPAKFLEGVYKCIIYNDRVSLETMKKFHDKFEIQDKLKDKCEEVYQRALKKKERMLKLAPDDQKKETEIESWRLALYIVLCITIIGALSYWAFRESQYEENKKKASLVDNLSEIDRDSQEIKNNNQNNHQIVTLYDKQNTVINNNDNNIINNQNNQNKMNIIQE